MGELISDVAQKFELAARTREVNLHIDVPGPLPQVSADVSMIERVVTNLLDNAMRHTPSQAGRSVWRCGRRIDRLTGRSGRQRSGRRCPRCGTISFQRPSALSTTGLAGGPGRVRAADRETNAGAARRGDQADGVREAGHGSGSLCRFEKLPGDPAWDSPCRPGKAQPPPGKKKCYCGNHCSLIFW